MALMNNYGERSVTLVKGEGVYVWDKNGKRFLDGLSGIAVCGLGHRHPAVTQAICDQAERLVHVSNLYLVEPQVELAEKLARIANMETVFFSNSGAEANEAALKIARKYGNDKGIKTPHVITAESSFHGRTMATLTATGNDKIKAGFTPLVEGFSHVPYDDIDAIEAAATDQTVAVMIEPVQGEGGVHVPNASYLKALRALCDKHEWLLITDEIQTGNGRTGTYFAFQQAGILPDVVTTAKGLANGMPLGACLARGAAATILQPGTHGSTFGGNPIACAAANATVDTIESDKLCDHAKALGEYFLKTFGEKLANNPHVKDIRGLGLMIGVELTAPCADIVPKAMERGILLNVTAGNTIRLLPPLVMNYEQADSLISAVVELIAER